MWEKHNNILSLWNQTMVVGKTQHSILNLWNKAIGVGQTQQHLNLWNKAIGVGQTQQHLKSVKSNNSCGTNTTTS